ncbi:MAG: protein translocase subunit SecDF [Bernardetiaceae bacterium]|jgi:SecD/SecF fusion protein|nr:protein translocase subunit SecDF [Bernardetiaceae bacterium]
MRNRGFIIGLTVIITLLCLFYLSFTIVSYNITQKANTYARDAKGNINYDKRQKYFDSLWEKPVYNLGITSFTLKEVKEFELHLGLDLQGGMHVVMEVSPVEVINALAGPNANNPMFRDALSRAQKKAVTSQDALVDIFFSEYEALAGTGNLAKVFANASNAGSIDFKTPDQEVKKIIRNEVDGAIDRSYEIVKSRIDKFGVTNPNVQRMPGTDRIQVELPGVDNPARVRKLLQGVAKLEFYEVWQPNEYQQYLQTANDVWMKKQKAEKALADPTAPGDTTKKDEVADLFANQKDTLNKVVGKLDSAAQAKKTADSIQNLLASQYSPLLTKMAGNPQSGMLAYAAQDTAAINQILNDPSVKGALPADLVFMWDVKPMEKTTIYTLNAIKKPRNGKAPLTGEAIADANQDFDERGRPEIQMRMRTEGARIWKKLTGANVDRQIAIVLDNYVYSAPVVQGEIGGGVSSITGSFTIEEAKDLANILKVGKLPAPTRIVEEAVVGPSLGQESIDKGLKSVLIGFAIVVLFMGVYYAKSGWVANAALLFNIFFIVGILANMEAALTLPGIAGIVLTIGMAVDANVLIFERVREEMRAGKKLLAAIDEGYSRAFWTIFDSNLTTLLVAFFLFVFGTGPIKGFATTLMVGIFCSFFTAVYVSRVMVYALTARKGDDSNLSFALPSTFNLLQLHGVNFIGKRKIAYAVSGTIIAIGFALIAVQGLNLGTDFKGGRTYVVEFNAPIVASDIRSAILPGFNNSGTEVKIYDTNNKIKVTTSFLTEDDSDQADAKVLTALQTGLQKYQNLNPQVLSSSKVGATVASDIRGSALESILASLIAIFAYIILRFRKWQFGLGAVLALFHDVFIVVACTAIARALGFSVEVDQVYVAAILTIIGYSINDTVVVFDRVREYLTGSLNNSAAFNREGMTQVMNDAINSTFSRTIITALTTFIVVFILFLFGGEALRGFSFAMVLGLIFGTYSSIFIATAIVADTMKPAELASMQGQPEQKPEVKPNVKTAKA